MFSGSNRTSTSLDSAGESDELRARAPAVLLTVAIVLVLASAFSGCKDKKSSPPAVESLAKDAAAEKTGKVVLRIMLDKKLVAELTMADLEKRPRLADLLPEEARDPAKWKLLEARARSPKYQYMALPSPTKNFPGQVAIVFRDRKGMAAFGMERPGEKPVLTTWRAGIRVVRVWVTEKEDERGPPKPEGEPLVVSAGKDAERSFTAAQLEKLSKITAADDQTDGWQLRDIIELVTPLDKVASARLTSSDGGAIELTSAELLGKDTTAFIKLNRQGRWRFKMWRTEKAKTKLAKEARDVTRIEVTSK